MLEIVDTPPARSRLLGAFLLGPVAGTAALILLLWVLSALHKGPTESLFDVTLVYGLGLCLYSYLGAAMLGWPVFALLRLRGSLVWWQVLVLGAGTGAVCFLPFTGLTSRMLASTGGGVVGALAFWVVLGWPRPQARIAV